MPRHERPRQIYAARQGKGRRVTMPFYEDEVATGEMLPIARALTSAKFINNFGIPDGLLEEQYHKAKDSLPWPGFDVQFAEAYLKGISKCESPIEKMILPWLLQAQYQFFIYNPCVLFAGETREYVHGTLAVVPQLPIGRYRVDFALAGSLGGPIKFVILECDGKEFHDGFENKKRDERRDNEIRKNKRVLDIVRVSSDWIMADAQQAAWYAAKRVLEAWCKK